MILELPDAVVQVLADAVAQRVSSRFDELQADSSPWLTRDEAIAYTRLPKGTFDKRAASGDFPAHGGRTKVFHRAELDAALGYAGSQAGRARRVRMADAA
jgi:hypothetical protein